MTKGWTRTCGGGVQWGTHRPYKNAITNEEFLRDAVLLHDATPGDTRYATWALREWRWFSASGMLTRSHLVVGGLTRCRPRLGHDRRQRHLRPRRGDLGGRGRVSRRPDPDVPGRAGRLSDREIQGVSVRLRGDSGTVGRRVDVEGALRVGRHVRRTIEAREDAAASGGMPECK